MADLDLENDDAFGRAVTARRAELGLTRKDVVGRCGLSYPYVADIESGRKRPSAKALHALAGALELRPSELLERAEVLTHLVRGSQPSPSAPLPSVSAPTRAGAGWFKGDLPLTSALRVQATEPGEGARPETDPAMRSLVRDIVREELDRPSSPRLDPAVEAHLPAWFTQPARTAADQAIHAVVLDRMRQLGPGADAEQVEAEISLALDDLVRAAKRRRARRDRG